MIVQEHHEVIEIKKKVNEYPLSVQDDTKNQDIKSLGDMNVDLAHVRTEEKIKASSDCPPSVRKKDEIHERKLRKLAK